jgi:hypothetical protein
MISEADPCEGVRTYLVRHISQHGSKRLGGSMVEGKPNVLFNDGCSWSGISRNLTFFSVGPLTSLSVQCQDLQSRTERVEEDGEEKEGAAGVETSGVLFRYESISLCDRSCG